MKHVLTHALAGLLLFGSTATGQDDFAREGKPAQRAVKDPLEGKVPPALSVENWLNSDGKKIELKSLRGRVVVLDFWGTW